MAGVTTVDIEVWSNEDLTRDFVLRQVREDVTVVGKPTLDQTEVVDVTDLTFRMGVLDPRGNRLASWTTVGEDGLVILDGPNGKWGMRIPSTDLTAMAGKDELTYDVKYVDADGIDKRLWGGNFIVRKGAAE